MSPTELEKIRSIIVQRSQELESELQKENLDTAPISPDVSIGRLSRLDSMQMQQMALEQERRKKAELNKLNEAMGRLNNGTYGNCMLCRQAIGFPRLEAQPSAILCIQCAH